MSGKIHKTKRWLTLAQVLFLMVLSGIVVVGKLKANVTSDSFWGFVKEATMPYLLALLLALLFYRVLKLSLTLPPGVKRTGFSPRYILWGAILVAASQMVVVPVLWIFPGVDWFALRADILLPTQGGIAPMLVSFLLIPLLSELLFRVLCFGNLRYRIGLWWALIISSVMAGVVEIVPWEVLSGFAAAMVYGAIYHRSGSLFTTLFVHSIYNGLSYLIFLFLGTESFVRDQIAPNITLAVVLWAGSLIALIVFFGRVRPEEKRSLRKSTKVTIKS